MFEFTLGQFRKCLALGILVILVLNGVTGCSSTPVVDPQPMPSPPPPTEDSIHRLNKTLEDIRKQLAAKAEEETLTLTLFKLLAIPVIIIYIEVEEFSKKGFAFAFEFETAQKLYILWTSMLPPHHHVAPRSNLSGLLLGTFHYASGRY